MRDGSVSITAECRATGLRDRKTDHKMRFARCRLHRDLAAVTIDNDPADDVETQSGAFARLLGGDERIEDPGGQVGRNTWAVIPDIDNRYAVFVAGADGDLPAPLHCIDSIINEIRPHLVQLGAVRPN